jgi:uridine kinase
LVNIPTYCYKTHLRKHITNPVGKSDILVIDGLFILFKKNIRNFFDLTIFLDLDVNLRIKRRIKRDLVERGRKKLDVLERFEKMINPMHEGFVEPTKKYAKLLFKDDVQYDLLFQELELLSDEIINKNKKQ